METITNQRSQPPSQTTPLKTTEPQTTEPQKVKVAVYYRVASFNQLDNKEYIFNFISCVNMSSNKGL